LPRKTSVAWRDGSTQADFERELPGVSVLRSCSTNSASIRISRSPATLQDARPAELAADRRSFAPEPTARFRCWAPGNHWSEFTICGSPLSGSTGRGHRRRHVHSDAPSQSGSVARSDVDGGWRSRVVSWLIGYSSASVVFTSARSQRRESKARIDEGSTAEITSMTGTRAEPSITHGRAVGALGA
jgi:hypothetical protein